MFTSLNLRLPLIVRMMRVIAFASAVLPVIALAAGKPTHDIAPAGAVQSHEKTRPARNDEDRLISLVMLLKSPRHLDERSIAAAIGPALGVDFSHAGGAENSVVAKPPYFQVRLATGSYVINDIAEPYGEATDKAVNDITEPKLRAAVASHRAWLSVDWAAREEPADVRRAYQEIGKIASALVGSDAVAVYSPELGRFSLHTDLGVHALAGDDPLALFGAASTDAGVVSVRNDDQDLRAAVAEAQKRWPGFVEAFQNKRGEHFAVKGRIVEGTDVEHMWISVSSIDQEGAHGTLDNVPTAVTRLKMGQDLHIKVADVEDWLYLDADKKPEGGFTRRALEQAAKGKSASQ